MSDVFEALLREALVPVDPPADLRVRVEQTLTDLHQVAADELEAWEISAMRDPRNWVRPVVATAVAGTAGTALVVLRTRQRGKRRRAESKDTLDLVGRTVKDLADEAQKLIERRWWAPP